MKFFKLLFAGVALTSAFFSVIAEDRPKSGQPTDEELIAFGEQIAGCLSNGQPEALAHRLDGDGLVIRVLAGLDADSKFRQDFSGAFISNLSATIAREYKAYEKAHFLRLQTLPTGGKRVLIRCLTKDGGFNYLAFVCRRKTGAGPAWVDVYNFATAELLSESSRRGVLPFIAESKKNFFEELTGKENTFIKNFPKIQQALSLLSSQDFEKANAIFDQLPDELRKEKFILVLRLQATQSLADEKYIQTMTDWADTYPDDPALDLVSIDAAFMRKDYDECIRRMESLQKRIGGDPYLDWFIGAAHRLAGRNDQALACARKALKEEPTLEVALDLTIVVSLELKAYDATVETLDIIQRNNPDADVPANIAADKMYADFIKSPEFEKWAGRTTALQPPLKSR